MKTIYRLYNWKGNIIPKLTKKKITTKLISNW
jgi:hypothetical protein